MGRNALSQGYQWSLYRDSLAESTNLLHNRNGGWRKRPGFSSIDGDEARVGTANLNPRNIRAIQWSVNEREEYVVLLWNEDASVGSPNQVTRYRILNVALPLRNELQPKNSENSRDGTISHGTTFYRGNSYDLNVAKHPSGLYFADGNGEFYPFRIQRRLNFDIRNTAVAGTLVRGVYTFNAGGARGSNIVNGTDTPPLYDG